jgi:hypothetical protein
MKVYFNPRFRGSDSIILSGSYAWGTAAPWDFYDNGDASCILSGNFSGMGEFSIGPNTSANGNFDLSAGNAVISEGANINGITVVGGLNIVGGSVTSFDGLTVGGALDLDTAGTYTITGSSIEEVTNSSGGNVTILLGVNSSITVNTGPNITIESPPSVLTLTGLQVNSEIRVYAANTLTELAGVENSTTVFTASINEPLVDVVIFNVQYVPIKLKSINLNSDVSLPIQQAFDRNYEND